MKVKEYIMMLQTKLDLCLTYIESVAGLNAEFRDKLPEEYREKFIILAHNYLSRYKEFLEVDDGEEEIED